MNALKYFPRINKRDTLGSSIVKYIVVDVNGFNSGEFSTKVEAFECKIKNPGSKIFKFVISELIK